MVLHATPKHEEASVLACAERVRRVAGGSVESVSLIVVSGAVAIQRSTWWSGLWLQHWGHERWRTSFQLTSRGRLGEDGRRVLGARDGRHALSADPMSCTGRAYDCSTTCSAPRTPKQGSLWTWRPPFRQNGPLPAALVRAQSWVLTEPCRAQGPPTRRLYFSTHRVTARSSRWRWRCRSPSRG
jgi:hypothetical protein